MPNSHASSRLRVNNGPFTRTPQSPLTAHHSPTANELMTDHASKENNQQLMKDLRKIDQAIDNIANASPAANHPEQTQQSSMANHHQRSEQKPVDIINQRLANYLRATNPDAFGHYDNRFGKKASNTRLAPKDDSPPPYEEDFRIPILYDTIASLKFQNEKLRQTNRLLHIRNTRNLSYLITSRRAAEESLQKQAVIKFRSMQERHHQQLLSLSVGVGVGVGFDPASPSSSSSMISATAILLEATHKTILANKTALKTLRRENSFLVAKHVEELKLMQERIEKLKMEKEKSEVNATALVWALLGLAAMWVLGLVLWWDI